MLLCIICEKPTAYRAIRKDEKTSSFTVVRRCGRCREEWANSLDQPASSMTWRDLYYKEVARNEELSQELQKAQDIILTYQQLVKMYHQMINRGINN